MLGNSGSAYVALLKRKASGRHWPLRVALLLFPSWLGLTGVSHAQCIAVGNDTGCGTVITIQANGSAVVTQTGQGPYDGNDDTLVGIVNNSKAAISILNLSSPYDIFGFDGDGIVTYGAPGNAKDTGALGGYGGSNAYFTNINGAQTSGTVNFITPIAPGGTGYFSLENSLAAAATSCSQILNGSVASPSVGNGGLTNKSRTITGTFTPQGATVQQAQQACGFTGFNWQQTFVTLPDPSPYVAYANGARTLLTSKSTPFNDPPAGGGYTYEVDAPNGGPDYAYPFYCNAADFAGGGCKETSSSVTMSDTPTDQCLPNADGTPSASYQNYASIKALCSGKVAAAGSALGFKTDLIGIFSDFVAGTDCIALQTCVDLGLGFSWTDSYNGTVGGIAVGKNFLTPDDGSGTGMITITGYSGTTTYSFSGLTVTSVGTSGPGIVSSTSIDTAQPFYLAGNLGTSLLPNFIGGALRIDQANFTSALDFTADASGTNTIDLNGNVAAFSGNFSNAVAGTPGTLALKDGAGGGTFQLSGMMGTAADSFGTITNDAAFEVLSGGQIYSTGIVNNADGTILVDAGGQVTDDLANAGGVANSGTYNANVINSGIIANSGQWNGTLNNGGVAINSGTWTGDATNVSVGTLMNGGTWTGALANAGTFTNGTGAALTGLLTQSGGTTVNSGTLNGGAWVSGGTLTSTGTINGGLTVGAGATVDAAGQVNGAISNAAAFNVTGTLANDGSAFVNKAAGVLTIGGNAFTGLGAVTNAAGGIVTVGTNAASGSLGATSLANNGLVAMQNGRIGDRVVLSGVYAGGTGSVVSVDVNMASNTNQADRIVAASTSGASTISIQNVGPKKIYFSTPIVLVSSASGTGTFSAASDAATTATLAPNGVIDYHLQAIGGTQSWGIVASVDTAKVSSVAAGATSLLASVNSEFLPDVHDLIGEDPNHERWSGQVWGRTGHSADTVDTHTISSDPNSPGASPQFELQFNGVQFGGGGRLALQNSTLHFGVTAGYVEGSANDPLVTHTDVKLPFYGVYGAAVFSGALVDLEAYHDELTLRPDATITEANLKGRADNLSASLALPRMVAGYRVEPFARYTYTNIRLNGLTLSQGAGALQFADLNGYSAAIGVRINPPVAAGQRVAPPFLLLSIEQDAGHKAKTTFVPDSDSGASNIDLTTRRTGTFVHLGTGMTAGFGDGSTQAYARADMRMGSTLSGYSLDLGIRKRF